MWSFIYFSATADYMHVDLKKNIRIFLHVLYVAKPRVRTFFAISLSMEGAMHVFVSFEQVSFPFIKLH